MLGLAEMQHLNEELSRTRTKGQFPAKPDGPWLIEVSSPKRGSPIYIDSHTRSYLADPAYCHGFATYDDAHGWLWAGVSVGVGFYPKLGLSLADRVQIIRRDEACKTYASMSSPVSH